jgi:hypothetical protein
MKAILLFFCALCVAASVSSQNASKADRIYKKDNSVIDCKIIEVTSGEIKYKKANYLDGPTYSLAKNEVVTIQYANGDSEVMNAAAPVVRQTQNTSSPTAENSNEQEGKGSSQKFYEYVGDVYFKSGGVYIGGDYDFYWRLDDDTQNSNMYLGFGIQGYYGFGTTGTYGETGIGSNGAAVDISGATQSSSVLYVPAQFRIFPSNSNFFVEAQLGPAVNFWSWSGTNNIGYQSDSGVKLSVAPGINVGYVSKGGFGLTARWNSALGVGLGLNISYLSRNK